MRTRAVGINELGRDFVVGDVHGCFRTLERALRTLEFDPRSDRVFGVGDLVNRGPHSRDALEWLKERFDAVTLGNHERFVIKWLRARLRGRRARPQPWQRAIEPSDYGRWWDALDAMPPALTIETGPGLVAVVHAKTPHRVWSTALEMVGLRRARQVSSRTGPGDSCSVPGPAVVSVSSAWK